MTSSAMGTIDAPQKSKSTNMSREAMAPLTEACASRSRAK